ncbi:hypothetical protein LY76DRAFT_416971 [Colletotrichum caudatum]|nr:hypothetical protein LY76DRAFT_416971 [Colletotrichum caudatum]
MPDAAATSRCADVAGVLYLLSLHLASTSLAAERTGRRDQHLGRPLCFLCRNTPLTPTTRRTSLDDAYVCTSGLVWNKNNISSGASLFFLSFFFLPRLPYSARCGRMISR